MRLPLNLANMVTISRILIVPVIALLLYAEQNLVSALMATALFVIATITDWLDGYLARTYNMESNLGKLLDPLADKLLIATVLIMLIPLNRAPAWIVALIIAREFAVTGVRAIATENNVIIAANWLGKYKTAFQCAACIALLLHYQILTVDCHKVGEYFLFIATFFTLWSGYDYIASYIRQSIME